MIMNGNGCLSNINRSMQQIAINDSWNNPQECLKNMDYALQHCIPGSNGIILGPSAINFTHSMGQGVYGNRPTVNRLNRSKSLNRCKSPGAGLILTGNCMTPSFCQPQRNCLLHSASGGAPSCCCSQNGSSMNVGKIICQPFQRGVLFRSSINANLQNNNGQCCCSKMPNIEAVHYFNNNICTNGTCLPVKRTNCDVDCSSLSRVANCKKKFEANCSDICPQCKKIIPVNTTNTTACCKPCCTSNACCSRPTTPIQCCSRNKSPVKACCINNDNFHCCDNNQGIQTDPCDCVEELRKTSCCHQESVDCQTESCACDSNDYQIHCTPGCKPKSFNWSIQTESPKIANTWVAHTMELCDEDSSRDELSYHLTTPGKHYQERNAGEGFRYSSNKLITGSGGGGCGYSTGRAELDMAEMGLGVDFTGRNLHQHNKNSSSSQSGNHVQQHRYYRIRNEENEEEERNRSEERYQNQVTRLGTGRKENESKGRRLVSYLDEDATEIAYGIKNHEHFTEDIEGKEKLYSTRVTYNTTYNNTNGEQEYLTTARSSSPNPSLFSVENGCCEPSTNYYTQSYYPKNYRYRTSGDEAIPVDTSGYSSQFNLHKTRKCYDS